MDLKDLEGNGGSKVSGVQLLKEVNGDLEGKEDMASGDQEVSNNGGLEASSGDQEASSSGGHRDNKEDSGGHRDNNGGLVETGTKVEIGIKVGTILTLKRSVRRSEKDCDEFSD